MKIYRSARTDSLITWSVRRRREYEHRPRFISNLYFRPNLISDSVFRGLAEWREYPISWPNLIAASDQTLGKVATESH